MTTHPSIEQLIREGRGMTVPREATAPLRIEASPLSPDEREILLAAVDTALNAKRKELQNLLSTWETWYQDNNRHYNGQIENIAAGFAREVQNFLSSIDRLKVMRDNTIKGRIVAKADA